MWDPRDLHIKRRRSFYEDNDRISHPRDVNIEQTMFHNSKIWIAYFNTASNSFEKLSNDESAATFTVDYGEDNSNEWLNYLDTTIAIINLKDC